MVFDRPSILPQRYEWRRFWLPPTGSLDLSDAGFLRDPENAIFGPGELRTLEELAPIPALVLLSEPGMGKSVSLSAEHERLAGLPAHLGIKSVYVDLKLTASEDVLNRKLFESPAIEAWKASESRLFLFLDSLDEGMLRIPTLPHILGEGLRSLPTDRLSVRITCRTAAWPDRTLGAQLKQIWAPVDVAVRELAPLRRRDVTIALSHNGIDQLPFIQQLFDAQAVPFAIKPLTLDLLIRLFQSRGSIPRSTLDLYRQGCLALIEEANVSRLETGLRGLRNARQRLRIAGRIAAAVMFGRRLAIWVGTESETPLEDVGVSAIAGALEEGNFPAFTITDMDVREVLDSGLFSSRGDLRIGWAHQTYAEYLAATYLVEKGVHPQTILKGLSDPRGGLVPPLAVVGAWAGTLNREVRTQLIRTDPWTLLRGDVSTWQDSELELLVESLLTHLEQDRFFQYFLGIHAAFAKLQHPSLAGQLRNIIADRARKPLTRRLSVEMAENTRTKDLERELLEVALDRDDEPTVRAKAVRALGRAGGDAVHGCIVALLQTGIGLDPQSEIRGEALNLLWPRHLSAAKLFSFLAPSDERYSGAYAYFLYGLAESLTTADLIPALEWATRYVLRSRSISEFREANLADAIMFKAWTSFDVPALTGAFVEHVVARLTNYGGLCRGSNGEACKEFTDSVRAQTNSRRLFIRRFCQLQSGDSMLWSLRDAGFVIQEDFDWVLSLAPGGCLQCPEISEEFLCSLVSLLFHTDNDAQFELLYLACQSWPLLRKRYVWLVEGIPLQSAEATQLREAERQSKEMLEQERPHPIPDIPAKIEELLCHAEAGDWASWWKLNLVLMLTPTSRFIMEASEPMLVESPGWVNSDETTRRRIVSTATTYLSDAETSVELWFGRNPMPVYSNDVSAIRALILLCDEAPNTYEDLSTSIWDKWTPTIIGLRLQITTNGRPEVNRLLADAHLKAPDVFVASVLRMLRVEKARSGLSGSDDSLSDAHPFLFLNDLEGCWSPGLKAGVFSEMKASDLQPRQYASLLDALLKLGYEPALAHVMGRLDALDERTIPIVDVLLARVSSSVWSALGPKLAENDDVARAVMLRIAERSYYAAPFYQELGTKDVADIYILIERLFPPEEDPPSPSGFVSQRQMVTSFRDGIARFLAYRGTEDAVDALRRLVVRRPASETLRFLLSVGEQSLRSASWSPLTIKELFALTDQPGSQLITSAADLLEVLVQTLAELATEMHGAQTPVRDLWDLQKPTGLYVPLDENGLSDFVVRYLRQKLGRSGVFANREVEVKRRPGAPVGQRVDILVNAVRVQADSQDRHQLTAVIEVKGCWNDELFTALDEQLFRAYMTDLRSSVGVYLVGWFEKTKWDEADSRRKRTPNQSIDEVRRCLCEQAAMIPEGYQVAPVVLDVRTPGASAT